MIALEPLYDDSVAARNFDRLAQLVPDLGGKGGAVRYGRVTLTFTASTDSNQVTVTHGLKKVPAIVIIGNIGTFGGRYITAFTDAPGATTFNAFARADAAFTGTSIHSWLAIGSA